MPTEPDALEVELWAVVLGRHGCWELNTVSLQKQYKVLSDDLSGSLSLLLKQPFEKSWGRSSFPFLYCLSSHVLYPQAHSVDRVSASIIGQGTMGTW